jgi:hypothetical protein
MGKNRIGEFLRDPTLDRPTTEFFEVRFGDDSVRVSRETAARILAALGGNAPPRFVRVETITGSVAFIRTDTIFGLCECTRAQRAAQRRIWKQLDEEREEDEKDSYES